MERLKRVRTVLSILCVLSLAPATASAQQFGATGRGTLRGLPGVEVLVEPLQPEIESAGLSAIALARQASDQLQAAGITIYGSQRDNAGPSKPYVYIHIDGVAVGRGRDVAVAIQLHVRQTVQSLATELRIVDAMTWDAQQVVATEMPSVAVRIPSVLTDLLTSLIDDWRAVH